MATFSKNQMVNFNRNASISTLNTPIVEILPTTVGQPQMYVVENVNGWNPDVLRIAKFGLQANKKYLFVMESELTAV